MKAINAIPGEQEQSSPGGAPGQANARDEEAEEISATCISLAAACIAKRGLSVAFGGSPKRSHPSHCLGTYPSHRAESCRRPRGEISLMGGTCDEAETLLPALCSYPWESQEQALPRKFHTFMTLKGSKHSQYVNVLPPKSFKKVLNNK